MIERSSNLLFVVACAGRMESLRDLEATVALAAEVKVTVQTLIARLLGGRHHPNPTGIANPTANGKLDVRFRPRGSQRQIRKRQTNSRQTME